LHLIDDLSELGHARVADPVATAANCGQLGCRMLALVLDRSCDLGAYLPDYGFGNHVLDDTKTVAFNALFVGSHFTLERAAQRRTK